jgi:sodium transport system permease protein
MRSPALIVATKEIRENLRDRRTLFSALMFGPLFGPILFALMMALTLDRAVGNLDARLELAVSGQAIAPNLIRFLEENGTTIKPVPGTLAEAQSAVRTGDVDIVLVIPERYAERLRQGQPAPLDLVWDSSNNQVAKHAARARGLLDAYGRQLAAVRLQARGISPLTILPIDVRTVDVSTPAGRSVLVLGMMTYLILFATLMGGLYLAIDATAGERERGSLEALLTLPVERGSLIVGKIFATCLFMTLSLALTVTAFTASLRWVPLETLGMSSNFGVVVALAVLGVTLPFVPLGAALMTVIASFTRSYKEAQTWVTLVLLIPTLPILVASLYSLQENAWLMALPALSQHLLITQLLRGDPLSAGDIAISAGTSLVAAGLLVAVAIRLYRREALLG